MSRRVPSRKRRSPLRYWTVALSISESPDMPVLGLGREHLEDAMTELARHLIAAGASVAYGGDLRPGGFTEVLFEIVERSRRSDEVGRVLVRNYLAWPVHASIAPDALRDLGMALEGLADLVILTKTGRKLKLDRQVAARQPVDEADWSIGLTAMRRTMAAEIHARVVLGGKTSGYRGKMPGIAEEALIQLEAGEPLFVLGGFGGCARDLAETMGLMNSRPRSGARWPGRGGFGKFNERSLNNGLRPEENARLARTVHVDEAAALVMRGLLRRRSAT